MSQPPGAPPGRLELPSTRPRLVAACLVVFVLVTADVLSGGLLSHLDAMVRDRVQSHAVSPPGWSVFVGELGSPGVSVAVPVIVAIIVSSATWRWWPVPLAVGSWLVTEVVLWIVKLSVSRSGPAAQPPRPGYPGYFPSGHVALATVCGATVCFLVLVGRRQRSPAELDARAGTSVWVGAGLGVGASVYAIVGNFHWLTDCVGGLALGVVVATLSLALVCRRLSAPPRRLDL